MRTMLVGPRLLVLLVLVFAACGGANKEPMHPDPDSDDGGAAAAPAGSSAPK
jgi:hypothetical protein